MLSLRRGLILASILTAPSATVLAQQGAASKVGAAIELPKLLHLGTVPEGLPVLEVAADGTVRRAQQDALGAACVLRIDRRANASAVGDLLATLQAEGVARVHLAAILPDGKAGGFELGLPEHEDAAATVDLRLHRQRVGVPASSVVPLLQRMQRGMTEPFVLRIDAPGDAPFQRVVDTLAALQQAGVPAAVLRCREPEPRAAGDAGKEDQNRGAYAIDLGPSPWVAVSPRAVPQQRPTVDAGQVGCAGRAPQGRRQEVGGGAGGRYGGRAGGTQRALSVDIVGGLDWLAAQQRPEGWFADADGGPDVGATALAMLVGFGNGETLIKGLHVEMLRRGVGWLLDQQRDDGTFGSDGPGSTRRDALATYALAEAYGLSQCLLLRGGLEDGIAAIGLRAGADGGYSDGAPKAASDSRSTSLVIAAFGSAGFFRVKAPAQPAEIAAWFTAVDDDANASQEAIAAALFSRFFAGMDPKETKGMRTAAERLAAIAVVDDPWACYWTTYALYQNGGASWKAWSGKLAAVGDAQRGDGAAKGSWAAAGGESVVATTCLRLLTTQAYYRYARLIR